MTTTITTGGAVRLGRSIQTNAPVMQYDQLWRCAYIVLRQILLIKLQEKRNQGQSDQSAQPGSPPHQLTLEQILEYGSKQAKQAKQDEPEPSRPINKALWAESFDRAFRSASLDRLLELIYAHSEIESAAEIVYCAKMLRQHYFTDRMPYIIDKTVDLWAEHGSCNVD